MLRSKPRKSKPSKLSFKVEYKVLVSFNNSDKYSMGNTFVAGVGALLKSSLFGPIVEHSDQTKLTQYLSWLQVLLGSILCALLLSGATQASPALSSEISDPAATNRIDTINLLGDGIYFYGAASQPDMIGAAYLVFEAQNSQVVGAIFMPYSSFDCFQGHMLDNALALQITHSYTQDTDEYAIPVIVSDEPVATIDGTHPSWQLDGFFNLGAAREAELSILAVCQNSSEI